MARTSTPGDYNVKITRALAQEISNRVTKIVKSLTGIRKDKSCNFAKEIGSYRM